MRIKVIVDARDEIPEQSAHFFIIYERNRFAI